MSTPGFVDPVLLAQLRAVFDEGWRCGRNDAVRARRKEAFEAGCSASENQALDQGEIDHAFIAWVESQGMNSTVMPSADAAFEESLDRLTAHPSMAARVVGRMPIPLDVSLFLSALTLTVYVRAEQDLKGLEALDDDMRETLFTLHDQEGIRRHRDAGATALAARLMELLSRPRP